MDKNVPNEDTRHLQSIAMRFGFEVECVANILLLDPKFWVWSGASLKSQHHYGCGGLSRHIRETVELCQVVRKQFLQYEIDDVELFLAALYHDAGKLYDYEPVDAEYKDWTSASHKRIVHHISRSAIMWTRAVDRYLVLSEKYHEKVLHAILSHHGSREAGSPVAPKSRVAWLVHLCDGISARMYDAETWDIIKRRQSS